MHARSLTRLALAVALSTLSAWPALAGGRGHGGGPLLRPGGGFHGGFGGNRGMAGGMARSARGLPPVSGVIHERAGARPYYLAYGHTDTAARFGGFGRGGVPGYGHADTGLRRDYGSAAGYGAYRRVGEGRRRFAERRGFEGNGFVGGGFGGIGTGYGSYGAPGIFGDAGVYGRQGTYGGQGAYGQPGTYGGDGTYATQSRYGSGGVAYRSEVPLAARFAEPPLGPSPFAAYSSDDRYAYAASEDVGPGQRAVHRYRAARSDCACGARPDPVIYRYGIGTAY